MCGNYLVWNALSSHSLYKSSIKLSIFPVTPKQADTMNCNLKIPVGVNVSVCQPCQVCKPDIRPPCFCIWLLLICATISKPWQYDTTKYGLSRHLFKVWIFLDCQIHSDVCKVRGGKRLLGNQHVWRSPLRTFRLLSLILNQNNRCERGPDYVAIRQLQNEEVIDVGVQTDGNQMLLELLLLLPKSNERAELCSLKT